MIKYIEMIQELYNSIDSIISTLKKQREENDYLGLMESGLSLLELVPQLIQHSIDQESKYRKLEATIINNFVDGKRATSSFCETQAKASDFYRDWQRAKQFIELMYEMVNMAKAIGKGINKEMNAS